MQKHTVSLVLSWFELGAELVLMGMNSAEFMEWGGDVRYDLTHL